MKQYALPLGDAVLLGWGATAERGGTTPQLMRVWVDIQDSATCLANYQEVLPSVKITENMLCAGLPRVAGMRARVTAAAFSVHRSAMANTCSWVSSTGGVGCARPKLFGVYTRVASYADWIREEMPSSELIRPGNSVGKAPRGRLSEGLWMIALETVAQVRGLLSPSEGTTICELAHT